MAKFSLFVIIAIAVYLSCKRCYPCKYVIQDLPSTIKVDNNLNHGETIFTFTLLNTANNNQIETNKYLIRDDRLPINNFYFITIKKPSLVGFDYVSKIGIEKDCPPPGTFETFYLTLQYDYDCKYTVNVEVAAAIPEFNFAPQVEILIDNQTTDPFTVVQFELDNRSQCAQFNCSVAVRNSNKAFYIETGSFEVKTTLEYIRFDFIYALDIICYIPDSAISDNNKVMIKVIFRTVLAHTSPLLRIVSAESTYKVSRTHLLPNIGTRTALSAVTRTALSAAPRTAFLAVSITATSVSVKMGIYSTTSAPTSAQNLKAANNLFDTPSKIAAVSTGAGLVGLGAAGVLTYHASRRCRNPRIVSQTEANDKCVQDNSLDVS